MPDAGFVKPSVRCFLTLAGTNTDIVDVRHRFDDSFGRTNSAVDGPDALRRCEELSSSNREATGSLLDQDCRAAPVKSPRS